MKMERLVLGITLFVTGTLLFGMIHIATAIYNWKVTISNGTTEVYQTFGTFAYVLSIILMLAGFILLVFHYKQHWKALMNKDIPINTRKKLLPSQTITWENVEHGGTETLELNKNGFSLIANGVTHVKVMEETCQLTYQLELDDDWRTKKVNLEIQNRTRSLWSDGEGSWHNEIGPLPELDSAIDIDIEATPFSNSLPINRHDWILNQTREFEVVYITVPSLKFKKLKQSYTYKGYEGPYRAFLYKSQDYESIIMVDGDGIVEDYPNVFERRY